MQSQYIVVMEEKDKFRMYSGPTAIYQDNIIRIGQQNGARLIYRGRLDACDIDRGVRARNFVEGVDSTKEFDLEKFLEILE